jgi:hypothetical protein
MLHQKADRQIASAHFSAGLLTRKGLVEFGPCLATAFHYLLAGVRAKSAALNQAVADPVESNPQNSPRPSPAK